MFYILTLYITKLEFFKSMYLRGFVAFLLAFMIVMLTGNGFITYLKKKKFGESIREDGPSTHVSKKGTPTMGGVLIISSILLTSFFFADISNKFVIILLISTFLFSAIGFIDDYKKFTVNKKGLSGKKKLLAQAIIGLIVWLFICFINLTGYKEIDLAIINPFNGDYLYITAFGMLLFIIFLIMSISNAVNITDGLDGLATMPTAICAAFLATIAYFTGHIEMSSHLNLYYIAGAGEIGVFLASVVGACLGFLWYNFYPAQIFMGDTGSLTLGGILGVVVILLKQEFLLPILGFVFVVEAISDIIQVVYYKRTKKRIFRMAPLHHHFELSGLMETKITVRFWIATLICCVIALGIIRMRGFL